MTTQQMGEAPRVAFGKTVTELANTNRPIVMLDGDVGNSTRADISRKPTATGSSKWASPNRT